MTRNHVAWAIALGSILSIAPACATSANNTGVGGFAGFGTGGSGPDCTQQHLSCIDSCVCQGATAVACSKQCTGSGGGINTGGAGNAPSGGGGAGAVGGSSFGGSSFGGSSFGGSSFGGSSFGGSSFGGSSFGGSSFGGSSFGGSGGSTGSCVGNCGASSPSGCYCDSQCQSYGDCCADYTSACGGGGGGSGGGGGTCSVSLSDPTCDACMQQSCCSQLEACAGDQMCSSLLDCLSTYCATASDLNTCMSQSCSQYTSGSTLLNTYFNCMNAACSSSCGGA